MIKGEWSEYDLIVEFASFQSPISAIILVSMEFSQNHGIMFDNLVSQLMRCFDNLDELFNCVEDLYFSILCNKYKKWSKEATMYAKPVSHAKVFMLYK